jgi:hypothetical protein
MRKARDSQLQARVIRSGHPARQHRRLPRGGRTWEAPVTLQRNDDPNFFNDRPTVTADPYHPGVVHAVWERVGQETTNGTSTWKQPVYLAKSTDDGRTWATSKVVDMPANSGVIGTQLVALPDGTLLIGMHHETDTDASTQVIRSTDGGKTWSEPTLSCADMHGDGGLAVGRPRQWPTRRVGFWVEQRKPLLRPSLRRDTNRRSRTILPVLVASSERCK